MKRKYNNITIPYFYFDKKLNYSYYIYQNKMYTDLNKLFKDFLGSYLTYHYEVEDKVYEVYNLSEVIEGIFKYKDKFNLPKKYKKEYSDDEWDYIINLKKALEKGELINSYVENKEFKFSFKKFFTYKEYAFAKDMYERYKDISVPKKIRSKDFKHSYFVVAGNYYESIYHALDNVYRNNLYYPFGGTKEVNNRTHLHSHTFDDLIKLIFLHSDKFKIHVFQREYYSKQEIEFLTLLSDKLRDLGYHSVEYKPDKMDYQEYCYLKDNHKYISLLINNVKWYLFNKKYEKDVLESHKIK